MKYLFLIFTGIIAIVGVIVYATMTYSNLKTIELKNAAKFECAQSSRYTITQSDGSTIWYPAENLYKKCLEEKSVK